VKVVWSPLADRQVQEAADFIARDDERAAREWVGRLLASVEALSLFPDSGRVVPELRRADIRELLVPPYRVIYRRRPDVVEILSLRHQARESGDR
jgi:toxin ParE1/3/4